MSVPNVVGDGFLCGFEIVGGFSDWFADLGEFVGENIIGLSMISDSVVVGEVAVTEKGGGEGKTGVLRIGIITSVASGAVDDVDWGGVIFLLGVETEIGGGGVGPGTCAFPRSRECLEHTTVGVLGEYGVAVAVGENYYVGPEEFTGIAQNCCRCFAPSVVEHSDAVGFAIFYDVDVVVFVEVTIE